MADNEVDADTLLSSEKSFCPWPNNGTHHTCSVYCKQQLIESGPEKMHKV